MYRNINKNIRKGINVKKKRKYMQGYKYKKNKEMNDYKV